MEAQSLRVFPSADRKTGSGARKKINRNWKMEGVEEKRVVVKEESSSPELGLGVGAALSAAVAGSTSVIAREKCFTEAQWRELQHQLFIFRHFQYGLSVPLQLLLPILKGVADTHGSGFAGLYKQFPSFTGIGHLGFAYGKMTDPELQRCRRTDGKKWRCSKNVVPDQKYCERHMHRGRSRSRKHMETSEVNSPMTQKPSDELHTKLGLNTESVVPNPLGIQLSSKSSSALSSSPSSTVKTSSTNGCNPNVVSASGKPFSPNAASPGFTPASAAGPMLIAISCTTSVASNTSNRNIYKKDNNVGSFTCNNSSGIRSNGKGNIIIDGYNNSTGIGFSPRSVLQVSGCNHSCLSNSNSGDLEPARCRRTDGKKWRCRSAVLPNQKYCASHLHRGAKRRFADHEPATIRLPSAITAVTIARPPNTTTTANIQKAYYRIPNTNLSMSIPASSPLVQCNEKSTCSSDTDATITDNTDEYSYVSL